MRGLPSRKVASSQMHLYHTAGLKVAADLQPTNTSQRTRRILPLGEMTIKMTADTNTETGLPINPEGDQEADPSPDVKEVTTGAEGAQEVLPIHVLLEGIAQAGGPGHDPESDPSPGLGLTEDRHFIPTPADQNQDQDPGEEVVAVSEAIVIPDLQTASAQNRTPESPQKEH